MMEHHPCQDTKVELLQLFKVRSQELFIHIAMGMPLALLAVTPSKLQVHERRLRYTSYELIKKSLRRDAMLQKLKKQIPNDSQVSVYSALQGRQSKHKHYTAFLPIMNCCKFFGMIHYKL